MKTAAVIAEFNPFHNGHAYLIDQARRLTGADFVIALMSGDFVQRGEPAVLDKYTRTEMALHGGCDMVIEMPSRSCCASAEYFAEGAIRQLNRMGCIDFLCFGCETDNLALLTRTAQILSDEPPLYRDTLRKAASDGVRFPAARARAVRAAVGEDAAQLLRMPNNILAAEYIKALLRTGSRIQPVPVRRIGPAHDSEAESGYYLSAARIRRHLADGRQDNRQVLRRYIPDESFTVMENALQHSICLTMSDFSDLLSMRLLELQDRLEEYGDISKDIANRIRSLLPQYTDAENFLDMLCTKNNTRARLSRCLLSILLGRKGCALNTWRKAGCPSLSLILGFRKEASILFRQMAPDFFCTSSPVLPNDAPDDLRTEIFKENLSASALYRQIVQNRSGHVQPEILRRGVIII